MTRREVTWIMGSIRDGGQFRRNCELLSREGVVSVGNGLKGRVRPEWYKGEWEEQEEGRWYTDWGAKKLGEVRTKYFGFVSDDDEYMRGYGEVLRGFLEEHEECGGVICGYMWERGESRGWWLPRFSEYGAKEFFELGQMGAILGGLYRVEAVRGLAEGRRYWVDDYEWFCRLFRAGVKIGVVQAPLLIMKLDGADRVSNQTTYEVASLKARQFRELAAEYGECELFDRKIRKWELVDRRNICRLASTMVEKGLRL